MNNEKIHSFSCALKRTVECARERRLPSKIMHWLNLLDLKIYVLKQKIDTALFNRVDYATNNEPGGKYLFSSPVGKQGKEFLAKIIKVFGHNDFDYLIFVYDETTFEEEIFKQCAFIYEKGIKWNFAKKYLTPDYCGKYSYILFWDDDIDIKDFTYSHFMEIVRRNHLELAQPALSPGSYYSHEITLKNNKHKIGRYTDFVEIMVPVFEKEAWNKYWKMIQLMDQSRSGWGWGYDFLAKSFCGFKNLGIVDCETVMHAKPVTGTINSIAQKEIEMLIDYYKDFGLARRVSYGRLK